VTAQVETLPDGTRVTLRPHGGGRWLVVAFLLFWLAGWAAGELFAIGALLAICGASLGVSLPVSVPTGWGALGAAAFLLLWLAGWTAGGMTALFSALRLAFGADIVTILPDGWTIQHALGRWGHTRRYTAAEVQHLSLRRSGSLVAESGGKRIVLTTFGTPADRCWLLGLLREPTGPRSAATAENETRTPSGYQIEPLPDGTARVTRAARTRFGQAGCLMLITLLWNGLVGCVIVARLGWLPFRTDEGTASGFPSWGVWLLLTPFVAIGLGLLAAFLWSAFGREEWLLGPDSLTIRRTIPGRSWVREYSGGELALDVRVDSDNDEQWRLLLRVPGEERPLDRGEPAALRALGAALAARTGWSLQQPEEA
jgi:hypothetical protein